LLVRRKHLRECNGKSKIQSLSLKLTCPTLNHHISRSAHSLLKFKKHTHTTTTTTTNNNKACI
jgi:hypothetical protein